MSHTDPTPEWFYTCRGTKIGPVSDTRIKKLLAEGQLDDHVHVWRKGLKDWIPVRDSELSDPISAIPPPLSARLVGNGWVWLIAFLPIVFALMDVTIVKIRLQDLAASGWWNLLDLNDQGGLLTVAPKRPAGLPLGIPPALYALFGLLDEYKLRKAGYSRKYMPVLLLLIPVYLFVRASLLRRFPSYGVVWIVCFLIELIAEQS